MYIISIRVQWTVHNMAVVYNIKQYDHNCVIVVMTNPIKLCIFLLLYIPIFFKPCSFSGPCLYGDIWSVCLWS